MRLFRGPRGRRAAADDGSASGLTLPLLLISLYWLFSANRPFLAAALDGRNPGSPSTWLFVAALGLALVALHFGLLNVVALVAGRRLLKPLLALLLLVTALAAYYMQRYGVYLDATMLRNVLHTRPAEAIELIGFGMLGNLLLYAGLPLLLLWRWPLPRVGWRRRSATALAAIVASLLVMVVAALVVFQPLASWMRNQREVRYLITPANLVWSVPRVLISDTRSAIVERRPIGLDAAPGPLMQARKRPALVVVVVGETVRAANWGLGGYERQTTPELAKLPVINFSRVDSCGTNTETSLPCMFAPIGRRDYDEARIRGEQSLLNVVARAGVGVEWRDNQTGCKGVCDGVPSIAVRTIAPAALCDADNCFDEALLTDLGPRLDQLRGSQLLVLHQLGNHGPAYYRRYPPAFDRFQPACHDDDLANCSREQIVNAYDNAVLYTDHVLAQLIGLLQAHAASVDSALIYVSDHGESLGENRLFLHGVPYSIAPDVQTRVPMLIWLSAGFARANGIDVACLRQRATRPASHDNLFHTVLGLLDVGTALYAPDWDLTHGCRAASAGRAAAATR